MTTPSQSLKLIPYSTDPQPIEIIPAPKPLPAINLDQEITHMRGAMKLIANHLDKCDDLGKLAFYASTIARLSDSITRALLANLKLYKTGHELVELRAEVDRIFSELGWPNQG